MPHRPHHVFVTNVCECHHNQKMDTRLLARCAYFCEPRTLLGFTKFLIITSRLQLRPCRECCRAQFTMGSEPIKILYWLWTLMGTYLSRPYSSDVRNPLVSFASRVFAVPRLPRDLGTTRCFAREPLLLAINANQVTSQGWSACSVF